MHCSIPALYPPVVIIKMSGDIAKDSLESKIIPGLEPPIKDDLPY